VATIDPDLGSRAAPTVFADAFTLAAYAYLADE
jgi:hypothetical protein